MKMQISFSDSGQTFVVEEKKARVNSHLITYNFDSGDIMSACIKCGKNFIDKHENGREAEEILYILSKYNEKCEMADANQSSYKLSQLLLGEIAKRKVVEFP